MKVPFSWLREYCDPGLSAEEVAALLAAKAVEVERVLTVGAPSADGFLVGRVISAEKHPNADRLSVCVVDDGEGERTIVCGAPNVAAGQTVAVALPGAVMPGGMKLGKAKLRGVESDGMILSERELELGDDKDGIMVLGEAAEPGTPLAELFPVSDHVLELDLNPNRSDCLGVYGVAREVHAITGAPLAAPPWADDVEPASGTNVADVASVRVEVPELCPRFTARAFEGITMGASPLWLRARLRGAGQRSISNAVDITNYVMLMTAQPLHAFDLDRVPGGEVIVRVARDGETMTTLDGVERTFDTETVLVCDREGPSGIAGIMGGQVSEVAETTTRILLEAATWNGVNILRTSSLLGLRTDASARFEKQLHPELASRAQRVASRLFVELCGAQLLPGTIDELAEMPSPHVVSLRSTRLDSMLGTHVELDEARASLEALEFEVADGGGGTIEVTVPVHRHYDTTREADLIEEVARLHGLDQLPRTLPAHGDRSGGLSHEQALRRRAEDALVGLGFDEIVSWHFVADDLAGKLGIDLRAVVDRATPSRASTPGCGPRSWAGSSTPRATTSRATPSASPSSSPVAPTCPRLRTRRAPLAMASSPAGCRPRCARSIASAAWRSVRWCRPPGAQPARPRASTTRRALWRCSAQRSPSSPRSPLPRSPSFTLGAPPASRSAGATPAGWASFTRAVAGAWDLPGGAGFEIDVARFVEASTAGREPYRDVTTFPPLVQDLAVTVPEDVPAGGVREAVVGAAGELLESARVFDLYRGAQVGEGRKSIAVRLEFRAADRTLTDEEVAPLRDAIEKALEGLGGSLR